MPLDGGWLPTCSEMPGGDSFWWVMFSGKIWGTLLPVLMIRMSYLDDGDARGDAPMALSGGLI